MADCKAAPARGLGDAVLFRFGSWFGGVVERLVWYLGAGFGRLHDRTRRCY